MDLALVNMFTVRMRIGEFDPKKKFPMQASTAGYCQFPRSYDLAVEVATKTPVLLKNNIVRQNRYRKALPVKA